MWSLYAPSSFLTSPRVSSELFVPCSLLGPLHVRSKTSSLPHHTCHSTHCTILHWPGAKQLIWPDTLPGCVDVCLSCISNVGGVNACYRQKYFAQTALATVLSAHMAHPIPRVFIGRQQRPVAGNYIAITSSSTCTTPVRGHTPTSSPARATSRLNLTLATMRCQSSWNCALRTWGSAWSTWVTWSKTMVKRQWSKTMVKRQGQ